MPDPFYSHKVASTPAAATINHRPSGTMDPAPDCDDDPVCNDAPVPDAVDEDPPRAVDVLCEPVAPVESAPVAVAAVISAAAVTVEDPLTCVAAASLPESELAAGVGDPTESVPSPAGEPPPAAEVGALAPWGDVAAAGCAFSEVVVAAAGAVAGTVASVVGGAGVGARVVAKLEVD